MIFYVFYLFFFFLGGGGGEGVKPCTGKEKAFYGNRELEESSKLRRQGIKIKPFSSKQAAEFLAQFFDLLNKDKLLNLKVYVVCVCEE